MYLLLKDDGVVEYPYDIKRVAVEHPRVTFPTTLTEELLKKFNIFLAKGETPEIDHTLQMIEEESPEFNGDYWERKWKIEDRPLEGLNSIAKYIPSVISPRQARLILLQAELLDDVEAMLTTNREMQIWWEYSLEIERNSEHIINAGLALGLTDEQLDNLFIEGSKL
jgi:hypothetical protein